MNITNEILYELEKEAAISSAVKSILTSAAITTGSLGVLAGPHIWTGHQNAPIMKELGERLSSGNANVKDIIKQHDPSLSLISSKSQLDTAKLSPFKKRIIGSQISPSGKFSNSYFVPGDSGRRYMISPEMSDSNIVAHELGHSKDYSAIGNQKLWDKKPNMAKEISANKLAPFKTKDYENVMGRMIKTYKNVETAKNINKGTLGLMGAGLLGIGGSLIRRIRR